MTTARLIRIAASAALFLASATMASALPAWHGSQKAVVVLVEWNDRTPTVNRVAVNETFFDDSTMSLRSLFLENSHGAFDLSGDVLDWRRSNRAWNSSAGCNLDPIVSEAWRLFGSDIDISSYDSDGNGKIDNFFIVHSGRIGSDRVGPDCTFTSSSHADFTIVFQSEGLGSVGQAIPIGFYVHEGGHGYYNLPDLYEDHYHGRYGIGMWGMMGLGAWGVRNDIGTADLFRYPAHFEPLSKVTIGWVTPRVVSSTTRGVEIRPVELSNDIVAVPAGGRDNFYLEYRSDHGFSAGHQGHGLLIWKNFTVIQADGRDDLNNGTDLGRRPLPPISENFGDDSDPFPGSLGITAYEDQAAGVRFENIVQLEDKIVVDIVVSHPALPYAAPFVPDYRAPNGL